MKRVSIAELEERVTALEKKVEELIAARQPKTSRWWVENTGQFRGDAACAEIVRLGREYRESLRPKRRSRRN